MSKNTASSKIQNEDMITITVSKYELTDEIWQITTSLRAVSDLMLPQADLHAVDREALATLVGYLGKRLNYLMNQTE